MPRPLEDLESAVRHGRVRDVRVPRRNDRIARAPDEQRRHALRQVTAIEHGDRAIALAQQLDAERLHALLENVERILAQCRNAGCTFEEIEVRKADLEDVFVQVMNGPEVVEGLA